MSRQINYDKPTHGVRRPRTQRSSHVLLVSHGIPKESVSSSKPAGKSSRLSEARDYLSQHVPSHDSSDIVRQQASITASLAHCRTLSRGCWVHEGPRRWRIEIFTQAIMSSQRLTELRRTPCPLTSAIPHRCHPNSLSRVAERHTAGD